MHAIARKCDTMSDLLDKDEVDFLEAQRLRSEAFDLISIRRVAELLGVSVRSVRRWQADGKAPPRFKHGRELRYRKSDLHLWPKSAQVSSNVGGN